MKKNQGRTRRAEIRRKTAETEVRLALDLDGAGSSKISTGIRFLDHMLAALALHSLIDLEITAEGDVDVDDHHTVEDVALALGDAVDRALGDRAGIARFGWAYAPLDEALARAAIDLSCRPCACVDLGLARDRIGGLSAENAAHFVRSLAAAARAAIHLDVIRGENDHHRVEAAFKALALALRQALSRDGAGGAPSTKGVLG